MHIPAAEEDLAARHLHDLMRREHPRENPRGNVGVGREYLAPGFHPRQQDASRARQWPLENAAQFSVVGH